MKMNPTGELVELLSCTLHQAVNAMRWRMSSRTTRRAPRSLASSIARSRAMLSPKITD